MTSYTSPGVYVQELPGPQLISSVTTSNTAFVGMTETGPYNTPVLITSWNQYVATFGGFMWGAQLPLAVYAFFIQGGAICYVVRAASNPPTAMTPATYTDGSLTIRAASPGAWGGNLSVSITNYPVSPNDLPGVTKPVFAINVYYQMPAAGTTPTVCDQIVAEYAASNGLTPVTGSGRTQYLVESFPGFSGNDLLKPNNDPTQASNLEVRINSTSLFIRVAVGDALGTRPANVSPATPLSGGAGTPDTTPLDLQTALASLDVLSDISLLVVPETSSISDLATQRNVVLSVIAYVENRPRKDLFYIVDPPINLSPQDVEAFKTGVASADQLVPAGNSLHSSYGALYYPWITVLDSASDMNVPVPPSGTMAGTYAATDQAVGPWQAAAGITYGLLNNATGVERVITQNDQSVLNPQGIDAIRSLPNYGIVAYGARTLSTDPSLIYVSVRRLLMEIEVSLYWGLQWVVFQPNTSRLWGTVTRDVTEYLTSMWQAGALFGATAADAFQVQCDANNNPPDLQAQGQLYIDIKVRPVFPAEFVIIRIQQATLGST